MAKKPALTDDQLLAAISAAEEFALGHIQSAISSDRADAIDRYYGRPYGDEKPGRSSVVSRDVADVIEGVVANVAKPFLGGSQMVLFSPNGPDDEEQAEQETDFVNYIALERNNGFIWLVSAIKDALWLRAGYVKGQWTTRSDVVNETYQGLSDEELGLLVQDEVEIVQHSEYPAYAPQVNPMTGEQIPGPMLHDVKVRRSKQTEYVEIMPVPPDEILVSERSTSPSLQDCDFVQHRSRKTLSELRQAGYDVDDDIADSDDAPTIEDIARARFENTGDLYDDQTGDPSRRVVLYKESYIRLDRDGTGIAQLRRVCQVGQTLLMDEEADIVPIAAFSALVIPHQHLGMSIYDLVEDIAKIKTNLMRSYLDNRNLQNNSRTAVDILKNVNIDDFLRSVPGGIVRGEGNPNEWMLPIVVPDTSAGALQGLEYLDTVRENRTGYTRNSAGMDNDALTNKTLGGMQLQLSQSQLRLEMIARTIAETGMRDIFRIIHALTLQHSTREEKVRLRGKWVPINPREWVRRYQLSITVGLGTGTQEQQLGKLMAMMPVMQQGQALGLVGVDEAYQYAQEAFKLSGYKNPEQFIHAPAKDPQTGKSVAPPPPEAPQVQVAKLNLQGDAAKNQMAAQQHAVAMQQEAQVKQADHALQQEVQRSNDQRDTARMQLEYQFKSEQAQRDAVAADLQHQREQESAIQIANINAASKIEVARIAAAQSDGQALEQAAAKDAGYKIDQLVALVTQLSTDAAAPTEIVRGPDGRAGAIKKGSKTRNINRGPDGAIIGIQ